MEHFFTESEMERDLGFARAVLVDGWIYVSGSAGMDHPTGTMPSDIEGQTRKMLANLERALNHFDSGFEDVVKRAIYIRDVEDTQTVYRIIGELCDGKCTPASQGFRMDFLHPDIKVEMTLIARQGAGRAQAAKAV